MDGLRDQYFFIGMIIKRPRRHILLRGFPSDREAQITLLEPSSKEPVCFTSHELFLSVLTHLAGGEDVQAFLAEPIRFQIHTYAVRSFQALHTVYLNDSSAGSFDISTQRSVPKRQTRLSGLMKVVEGQKTRKRKRKAASAKQGHSDNIVPEDTEAKRLRPEELDLLARGFHIPAQPLANAHTANEDESSWAPLSDSSSASDSSSSELIDEIHQEPAQRREAKLIRDVAKSHKQLMQDRGEAYGRKAPEGPRSETDVADTATAAPSGSRDLPAGNGRVFCHSKTGLVAAGLQTHSRLATCRQCSRPIAKGGPRFQYVSNRQKFGAWLHADCTLGYLKLQRADVAEALDFLRHEKGKGGISPDVRDAILKLEHALG